MNIEAIRKKEHGMMYLATFSRSYHTFLAIHQHLDVLDDNTGNLVPFRSICNALLCDAAISWCKVFGSNAEQTHWKSIVEDEGHFRSSLFSELKITQDEFRDYWASMLEFRNNVVAHFNSEHFESGSTPSFDLAMSSAAIAHKYMRESISKSVNYTGPMCLHTYGQETSLAVLNRLYV